MRLKRRDFLRATVISATALSLGVSVGCHDDDGPDEDLDRFPQSVASGDPKATSVILWTRVDEPTTRSIAEDVTLTLQVATDENFRTMIVDQEVVAQAAHDGCVKVKLVDLDPDTFYWFRFVDGGSKTPTGRTKTAPAANADATIRFAHVVCQDYIDGYYNAYALMLENEDDIDFIVHLGDYIYEYNVGTGGPGDDIPERVISFPDQSEGATITRLDGSKVARSVANYRHLYQVHHSDSQLMRVQERYPMIVIWDDHEFSDDCHGATGTYFNGRRDEYDVERRQNSLQAFFEYIPFDEDLDDSAATSGEIEPNSVPTYESEAVPGRGCWRRLRFGQNLEMFLTDYRTYRPDHIVPEDAFPGSIPMDRAMLIAFFESTAPGQGELIYESQKAAFSPYLNIDDMPEPFAANQAFYQQALIGTLTAAYQLEGLSAEEAQAKASMDVSGNIATFVMNQLLTQYNASVPPEQQLPLIDDATNATLDTGISFLILGKTAFFSSTGSRYGVVKPTFDIYRAFRSAGQPENVFGEEQQAALDAFIAGSDAAYLCVANSVSTASLTWDFSQEPAFQGTDFGTAFYGNVDHFDGFPFRRGALLAALQARGNAFLISGDIHAHFLTKYVAVPELPGVVPDFTTTSISSTVFNRFVELTVEQLAPLLTPEQLERAQVLLVDELDQTLQESFANFNPGSELMVANTRDNGYVVMEVAGSGVTGRFVSFPHAEAKTSAYDAVGSLSVTERTFVYDGADVMES